MDQRWVFINDVFGFIGVRFVDPWWAGLVVCAGSRGYGYHLARTIIWSTMYCVLTIYAERDVARVNAGLSFIGVFFIEQNIYNRTMYVCHRSRGAGFDEGGHGVLVFRCFFHRAEHMGQDYVCVLQTTRGRM